MLVVTHPKREKHLLNNYRFLHLASHIYSGGLATMCTFQYDIPSDPSRPQGQSRNVVWSWIPAAVQTAALATSHKSKVTLHTLEQFSVQRRNCMMAHLLCVSSCSVL